MWNHNNYSKKFWDNSQCKCDQRKVILDGIELWVSKIIYKDICIKEHGLWDCGLVRSSISLNILRSTIVANAFSSDLETHKSQIFPMIAPRGVAKLSNSPKLPLPLDHFPSTSALQFQFRSVPEMWPLNYFVLEKFASSNGLVQSSNPKNLKYFKRRNLRKYKPSSQHSFTFI